MGGRHFSALVLILVLSAVLILLVAVFVLVLILIFVLVIHGFPPIFFLFDGLAAAYRFSNLSGFIPRFEEKTCNQSCSNGGGDSAGRCS